MFGMTLKQWRDRLKQAFTPTPKKKERSTPTGRKATTFALMCGKSLVSATDALTKSEARAVFKEKLGLRANRRLPQQYHVVAMRA